MNPYNTTGQITFCNGRYSALATARTPEGGVICVSKAPFAPTDEFKTKEAAVTFLKAFGVAEDDIYFETVGGEVAPTFAPGPFAVEPYQADHGASIAIVDKDHNVIALIPPLNQEDEPDIHDAKRDPHDQANASLLAASWELLEACLSVIEGGNIDNGAHWVVDIDDIRKIRAAIAKVKGGVL